MALYEAIHDDEQLQQLNTEVLSQSMAVIGIFRALRAYSNIDGTPICKVRPQDLEGIARAGEQAAERCLALYHDTTERYEELLKPAATQ